MAQAARTANHFELRCGETRITYSTTSFVGPPHLSYVGAHGRHNFSGAEIATRRTALGTEVSVTLENIPDLQAITLTVLIPAFRLPSSNEVGFQTLGIFTTTHTTIFGPPEGPAQTYEAITLHGAAASVDFLAAADAAPRTIPHI